MSKPIDYSKWDHIGDSDDEVEQAQQAQQERGPPRVTKFDAPMSVTIGGGGDTSSSSSGGGGSDGPAANKQASGPSSSGPSPAPAAQALSAAARPPAASSSKVEDVAENGDELEVRLRVWMLIGLIIDCRAISRTHRSNTFSNPQRHTRGGRVGRRRCSRCGAPPKPAPRTWPCRTTKVYLSVCTFVCALIASTKKWKTRPID